MSEQEDCIKRKDISLGVFGVRATADQAVENRDMQRPSAAELGSGSSPTPILLGIYGGLSRLL